AKCPDPRLRDGLLQLAEKAIQANEARGKKAPGVYAARARLYREFGQPEKAKADLEKAVQVALEHPDKSTADSLNHVAWEMILPSNVNPSIAQRAVELARRAVEEAPKAGLIWNTLGVAHYRAGDWKAAVETLEKSMSLRQGGDSFDWFFLAMAHW